MAHGAGWATEPIAVLGGGSWGTALAIHLARAAVPVRLWVRDAGRAAAIAASRRNDRYLPDVPVPAAVRVTGSAAEALGGAGLAIAAVPSHGFADVLGSLARWVSPEAVLVSATKGLERARGRRMSEIVADICPGRRVAVLSGPSFAREVALGCPAALVVASADEEVGRGVQLRLATRTFRLYTNRDVIGVEMAGALKNVIAIAAGLCDSLGLGESARAALITRGLAEMSRIGVAAGGSPATFAGLAGIGDLVLTCTGALSRNRALGLAVGRGAAPDEVQSRSPMVAEGARTVSAAVALARRAQVSAPICEAVSAVLHEGMPAGDAVTTLLSRDLRPEEEAACRDA